MSEFYLRELCQEDHVAINRWRNDRELIGYLGSPFRYISREVDEGWLKSYFSNRSNTVRLAICERKGGAVIGAVYLLSIDWISRNCEFAIWVGEKNYQGRGVGTFATQQALRHAFRDLNLNRVYLTVLNENKRAIELYHKIGFSIEGTLRQAVYKEGAYADMLQMSILAEEFSSVN